MKRGIIGVVHRPIGIQFFEHRIVAVDPVINEARHVRVMPPELLDP